MDIMPNLGLPELSEAKCILAIQPRYDDNDIAAGGTLYSLAQNGATLIYLTVTDDLSGVINPEWTITEAIQHLQSEQDKAAGFIGVSRQIRLGFPDAGDYDYFALRGKIIQCIRTLKPDLIFTCDPWTPYEAHRDHIMTGRATAEAAILYHFPLFEAEEMKDLEGYELQGLVFYNSAYPNITFDITSTIQVKQRAIRSYLSQFKEQDLEDLVTQTTFLAAYVAREVAFEYGESLKIVSPWMLHGVPLTMHL